MDAILCSRVPGSAWKGGHDDREPGVHEWLTLTRYVLFSIGNLKPLFESSFSACWKQAIICDRTWLAAVEYLEICGIIVGQILVGILGDWYAGNPE